MLTVYLSRASHFSSYRFFLLALFLIVSGLRAQADTGASVPYMPSVSARHHLQRLADEAGLAIVNSQWPLPARAVRDALGRLPSKLEPSLQEARNTVRDELDRLQHANVTLSLRRPRDGLVGFGDSYIPGSSVAVLSEVAEAGEPESPWLAAQLGLSLQEVAYPKQSTVARLDDSALVLEALGVNLQAFSRSHWWGPGWQSSTVLGNNATRWTGVGLQRSGTGASASPWLSWLGPWNLDLFLARARDPEVVPEQPVRFLFSGIRLSVKPHRLVEIGMSRTMQTEGRNRPSGLRNYLRAWTGRGTNADTDSQRSVDPGNQMAGYDVRVSGGQAFPAAGYVQVVGEDEANHLPSRSLLLAGVETWTTDGENRFFAEYADTYCSALSRHKRTACGTYRNGQYPQGYTNGTRWAGASQGPDSRLLSLGWLSRGGDRLLRVHYGRVGVSLGAYTPLAEDVLRGRMLSFSAQQTFVTQGVRLSPSVSWTRFGRGASSGPDNGGRVLAQWGAQVSWPLP